MARLKSILFFLLIIQNCFSQSITIRGYIFDYSLNSRMPGTSIYIDSLRGEISDCNGDFQLKVDKLSKYDTVKIRFISCYNLNFIDLPQNKDTIDLGGVPLFYYFPGYDMIDYFCGRFDFACKRRWKEHVKDEKDRIINYYLEQNQMIRNFDYIFNNKLYKINLENNCIDLSIYDDKLL
jgi:hypothetical protein